MSKVPPELGQPLRAAPQLTLAFYVCHAGKISRDGCLVAVIGKRIGGRLRHTAAGPRRSRNPSGGAHRG
jgi:hypothetical protein